MYDTQNISGFSRIDEENIYEQFDRTGFYRAKVISNIDPLNLGRVKIRIPSLHGMSEAQSFYMPDAHLPYAFPGIMSGAANHMGEYILPVEGSLVWVSFESGTNNFVYFGGIYCIKPEGDKYIYFNRNINNGGSIKVESDDIEPENDPHRYVIFKSIKGATIYIDDRDVSEGIYIKDRFGNSISMTRGGTIINSVNKPLKANYPYLITYYMNVDLVSDDPVYTIYESRIYEDKDFTTCVDEIIVGAKVVYLGHGEILGSGFITEHNDNMVTISTNALACPRCRAKAIDDYLAIHDKFDSLTLESPDQAELIINGVARDSVVPTEGVDPVTGRDKDQLIIDD